MAITLDQFRTISNGTHNVGQIMLSDDGNGLQKINNHVWQTSKNNVQTEASDNRAVRQALFDAFLSSGNLSQQTLNDIKTILLGGGNASRSLSRDFVKQLFHTVDNAKEGDDIVKTMDGVSKDLSERKVSVVKNNLVTSSKDAAYTIYASEMMDKCASEGLEGYKKYMEAFADRGSGDFHSNVLGGLNKMLTSLHDMIQMDHLTPASLSDGEQLGKVSIQLNKIYTDLSVGLSKFKDKPLAQDLIMQIFRRRVEKVYDHFGIANLVQDHLERILPSDNRSPRLESKCFNSNQAALLKDWFVKVALNKNFAEIERMSGNDPENDDSHSGKVDKPIDFYKEMTCLVFNSTPIRNLSLSVKFEILNSLNEFSQSHPDDNWLNDKIGESSLLDNIRTELFAELDRVFDSDRIRSLLDDNDKQVFAETFSCGVDAVEGKFKELSKMFQDEFDKFGANSGIAGEYV